MTPCYYPRVEVPHAQETPTQMLETIRCLKERIEELELHVGRDPSRIYLTQPYTTSDQLGARTPEFIAEPVTPMLEPPFESRVKLIELFLTVFRERSYFFMEPLRFRQSALLPFPFGHESRPSPALLSTVYLWGSVLSDGPLEAPYTPDALLACVLQNIPQDLTAIAMQPKFLLETLQAEVLLSCYYLYTGCVIEGRYHCAASIALESRLHVVNSSRKVEGHGLAFPLQTHDVSGISESEQIQAFWAVTILNNLWVAVDGSPSGFSYAEIFESPGTIQGVEDPKWHLNGDNIHAQGSSVVLLAKASTLLRDVIQFASQERGAPHQITFTSLDRQLLSLNSSLPALPGDQNLLLAHALANLATIRLHAPYTLTSLDARWKALAGAGHIVAGMNFLHRIEHADPIFGPTYATVATFYMSEMRFARSQFAADIGAQTRYRDLDATLGNVMSALTATPLTSAIPTETCFADTRRAYGNLMQSGVQ
ncbi:hypothetical protein C8R43DRAFT_1177973 [Mycena crocata]|nr:hypothetical protein C8R43DRAFT_1177973 [Mycena crocata]